MQTKLICAGAALIGVASYFAYLNYHYILTGGMFISGIAITILAIIKRDKKDKQIEEIHSEITNNSSKPTETSTEIIKSYMETIHKMEVDSYNKDADSAKNDQAKRGIFNFGQSANHIVKIKLSHIQIFTDNCINYIKSTQNNYLLDKPSVKAIFELYRIAEIENMSEIIGKECKIRGFNPNIFEKEPVIPRINNIFDLAISHVDAM